ncbi:uncharacterized protein METZ01_LOCUS489861, partial [marine metagenome]
MHHHQLHYHHYSLLRFHYLQGKHQLLLIDNIVLLGLLKVRLPHGLAPVLLVHYQFQELNNN